MLRCPKLVHAIDISDSYHYEELFTVVYTDADLWVDDKKFSNK